MTQKDNAPRLLKLYDSEFILAWDRQQRNQVLQQSKDSTETPTHLEPQQLDCSDTASDSPEQEPKEKQGSKEQKWQPAPRRHRQYITQKAETSDTEKDPTENKTVKTTLWTKGLQTCEIQQ